MTVWSLLKIPEPKWAEEGKAIIAQNTIPNPIKAPLDSVKPTLAKWNTNILSWFESLKTDLGYGILVLLGIFLFIHLERK